MNGKSVYACRYDMGRQLAHEEPVEADLVIGVPDSGLPPAEGYSHESGIPFGEGLIKNRYVGRTFIEPTQELRAMGVRMKLNPLRDNIEGKRLVVIDDSIVRGTTMVQLVKMLRNAGAKEIHIRINSPEVIWPCFYGIDTDVQSQLISANKTVDEICEYIGADSLAFLSIEGLLKVMPKGGYCDACFTGRYPVAIPESFGRDKFMEGFKPRNLDKPLHFDDAACSFSSSKSKIMMAQLGSFVGSSKPSGAAALMNWRLALPWLTARRVSMPSAPMRLVRVPTMRSCNALLPSPPKGTRSSPGSQTSVGNASWGPSSKVP